MKSTLASSTRHAVLSLSLLALAGCDRHNEEKAQETRTTGAPQVKPEEVKDDPARFYGKRVTLTGEVEDVGRGGRAFKLEGNDWLFPGEIRVLTRSPVAMGGAALSDDDEVVVTGTVRRFVVADVERDLGWDLDSEVEVELRDKPVLVADEIRRIEPAAKWTAQEPKGEIVGTVLLVTTAAPESLVGNSIRVERTKVQSVAGKGLWIGPSHAEQTFVLPAGGADISGIKAGDLVDLKGTVKKTPPAPEAIKSWNLEPTMRTVLEGEPVYVEANEVKRAAPKKSKAQEKPKGS